MLSFIKNLFGAKPATQLEVEVKAEVPYKVEVTQQGTVAVGEPPATVVIPVAGLMLTVEGAGEVAVPKAKKAAPAKKPPVAKKPPAPKKPRTPKAK